MTPGKTTKRLLLFLALLALLPATTGRAADEAVPLFQGQTIYVPAYSHIYVGDREQPFLLTVTLSLRNVDTKHRITLTAVNYYDTQGRLLKKYLPQPLVLKPLESTRYVVPQQDKTGGSGANFIVEWQAEKPVNAPIVEAVMIGAASQQGISFTSRGQAITTAN
ncbi:MAG: DUF3124 domain-containing protein [Thermodesulfobacteriota bacterium]